MIFLRHQGKILEVTDGLYTDESSVNHFDLIANLLELREKCNSRTSASCFIRVELGHIVEQDRNMFANKILSVLHKIWKFCLELCVKNDCLYGKSICKSLPQIYRLEVFIYLHESKKVLCGTSLVKLTLSHVSNITG